MKKKKGFIKTRDKAVVALVFTLAVTATSISLVISGNAMQEEGKREAKEIVDNSRYAIFNNDHRVEQYQDLMTEFTSGMISEKELLNKQSKIKDLDKDEYVKKAGEISEADKERYFEAKETERIGRLHSASAVGVMVISGIGVAVGTIINYEIEERKKKKAKVDLQCEDEITK